MIARTVIISLFLFCYAAVSQEVSLPADLRQHALTQYNASLFNPTFSLDRNNPQSVSFWTRWQWQQVDADPTTLFLNYSRRLNEKSGFGAAFFQHNTGIYFNTGGVVNYAYEVRLNPIIKLAVGANLFGFQQQLADTRFVPDPDTAPFPIDISDDFILQLAPGFNLSVENFSLSMASENLFDYNVTDKGANTETADKIFMGMASYDFPIMASDSTAFLRPSIYLRTIPEQDNQIGFNTLFSTQKYWAQAGYNNFYGISVGAGGTLFNRVSLGALVEFGTSSSLNTKDASFEIIASYFLGKPENRREQVVNIFNALEEDITLLEEEEKATKMQEELEKAQKIGADQKEEDELVIDEKPEKKIGGEIPETEVSDIDKNEAQRITSEEQLGDKERKRDSLDLLKSQKEALAALGKEERKKAKEIEDEAKKAEQADKIKKEEEARLVAEEAKRIANLAAQQKAAEAEEQIRKAEAQAVAESARIQKQKDSLDQVKKMEAITLIEKNKKKQRQADSIENARAAEVLLAQEKLKIQKERDSISEVKQEVEEQQRAEGDSIAKVNREKEEVTPQAGEKYEEVITEEGLEPGFYLIANVFGTKKYFDAFMQDLRNKGIEPGSFLRSQNNYNYAYLKRYNTIREARLARDNKFNGKYQGKTWIFRVVGE